MKSLKDQLHSISCDHVSDQILQHQRPSRARGLPAGALGGPGPGQGALHAGADPPDSRGARYGQFPEMSYPEIAYEVIKPYLGDLVPDAALRAMLAGCLQLRGSCGEGIRRKIHPAAGSRAHLLLQGLRRPADGPADAVLPEARKAEASSSSPPPRAIPALLWPMPSMAWIT